MRTFSFFGETALSVHMLSEKKKKIVVFPVYHGNQINIFTVMLCSFSATLRFDKIIGVMKIMK